MSKDSNLSVAANYGLEESSKTNEVSNETSYGVIESSTAREFGDQHDQPSATSPNNKRGVLVGLNSGQDVPTIADQRKLDELVESTASSMPDSTNRESTAVRSHYNQPLREAKFPTRTHYTTGGVTSTLYGNEIYPVLEEHNLISSPFDFGNSASVQATMDSRTPPNGQGIYEDLLTNHVDTECSLMMAGS